MKNELSKDIQKKIADLASMSNDLPGVIVLHDLRDQTVLWMADRGLSALGLTANQVVGKTLKELHEKNFNPDDDKEYVQKIIDLINRSNDEEIVTYFEQVKIKGSVDFTWHMSSVKIFARDELNLPMLIVSISIPIDSMHHMVAKAERLVEEKNFIRRNFNLFALLSKREQEVLSFLAKGKSAAETAEELFIALSTVESHRKNIKAKLQTSSYFELCEYARAFDLL